MAQNKAPSDLKSRMQSAVGKAPAPSMIPTPYMPPPPPKEEEQIPDLRELVDDDADATFLANLVEQADAWRKQEAEAKKARKPLTERIKKLLGEYGIGKMMVGEIRVAYFNCPRSSISKELLLSQGVSPKVIAAATVIKDAYTLRIGGGEEGGNGDE